MAVSTLVAVAVGIAAGVVGGGSLRNLGDVRLRWWLLLPLGIVLERVVTAHGVPAPFAGVVLAQLYLLAFAAANVRVRGMSLVLIGLALNTVAIVANHGMAVRVKAARLADVHVAHTATHHLATAHSRLMVLSDIIPVHRLHVVLSFGDLIVAVAVADVLFGLMRSTRPALAPNVVPVVV